MIDKENKIQVEKIESKLEGKNNARDMESIQTKSIEKIEKIGNEVRSKEERNHKTGRKEQEGRKFEPRMSKEERIAQQQEQHLEEWKPKTKLGKLVKTGKIKDIDEALKGKILEYEISDILLKLNSDILNIGQAKGKFGGGKRRAWRQTQRKTSEGNVPTFACMAVAGNGESYIGLGFGRAKETLPARSKAVRKAKLNITKIKRGCGSFDCTCGEPHSVPFIVEGKSGSCRVKLMPAPQGTGLVIGNELKKILKAAGIKDVYSVTNGKIRTTLNLAKACVNALKKTMEK
jgi:small subunit ribosomal protein S5